MWYFLKRNIDAFITVECSLLLTVILMVYAFLIGIGIFLYHQCILQSDIGILAVEGASMAGYDVQTVVKELQKVESRLYKEKYYMAEIPKIKISVSDSIIYMEGNGKVNSPVFAYGIGNAEWKIYSECTIQRNNPKKTIRLCKRVITLGEKLTAKEDVDNE